MTIGTRRRPLNVAHLTRYSQLQAEPYPTGLNPFRYPCLHPHAPVPTPGDPNDPNFRRFDPAAELLGTKSLTATSQYPPNHYPILDGQNPSQQSGSSISIDQAIQGLGDPQTDADAYASLTALLSASQGFQHDLSGLIPDGHFASELGNIDYEDQEQG